MEKNYAGDAGLGLIVDCGRDISAATNTRLLVRRPDGSTTQWSAQIYAINGKSFYLRRLTRPGDLSLPGRYRVQAALTLGDWSGRGQTAEFTLYRPFE